MSQDKQPGLFRIIVGAFISCVILLVVWNLSGGTVQGFHALSQKFGKTVENCIHGDCTMSAPGGSVSSLAVSNEVHEGYDRSQWKHWSTVDHSCWDTRDQVLYDMGKDVKLLDGNKKPTQRLEDACSVSSGTWIDPYSGQTFTDPSKLDIDHIVPLQSAYNKGGYLWDGDKREAYANDLDVLTISSASENRAKGSKTFDQWVPSNPNDYCNYAERYTEVLVKYGLTVTDAERDALEGAAQKCQ